MSAAPTSSLYVGPVRVGVRCQIDRDDLVGPVRVEPTKAQRLRIIRAHGELEGEEDRPATVCGHVTEGGALIWRDQSPQVAQLDERSDVSVQRHRAAADGQLVVGHARKVDVEAQPRAHCNGTPEGHRPVSFPSDVRADHVRR